MIAIDSNVFIHILENHPEFSDSAKRVFTQTIQSGESLCMSTLVITEILSGTSSPSALEFLEATHATQYEFAKDIAIAAGNLRRQNPSPKTADAIRIATAITSSASRFITNDHKLLKLNLGVEMVPLMSFVD